MSNPRPPPPPKLIQTQGRRAPFLGRISKQLHEEYPQLKDAVVGMVECPCFTNGKHDHFVDAFIVGDPRTHDGVEAGKKAPEILARFAELSLQEYLHKGSKALCDRDCRAEPSTRDASHVTDTLSFDPSCSSFISGPGVTEEVMSKLKPHWSDLDIETVAMFAFLNREALKRQSSTASVPDSAASTSS